MICRIHVVVFVVAAFWCTQHVNAQAYCALRDPARHIYELFPEATSFRSIVKTVNDSARAAVRARLDLDLHFNELGRHTLYVVMRDEAPVGFVHVRSEKGKWGLTEVAWALDPTLAIEGFRFQRCRHRQRKAVEGETMQALLRGRSMDALRELLDGSDRQLGEALDGNKDAIQLAQTAVRSALKTIVVTEVVWTSELDSLRALQEARHAFASAHEVRAIDDPYEAVDRSRLLSTTSGESRVRRETLKAFRVVAESGDGVGTVLRMECRIEESLIVMWWCVSPNLTVTRIAPHASWEDGRIEASFAAVVGMSASDIENCATAAALAGVEAVVLAEAHIGE